MEELLEVGSKAVNYAEKLGADEAELFLSLENHTSLKFIGGIFASRGGAVKGIKGSLIKLAEPWIKKKGVPLITSGIRAGVGVRAVVNKAMGFSSVSSLEESQVLAAVEEAVKIAKIRPPDPNWVSLPEPRKPSGQGVFDKRILDLEIAEILDLCVNCCVTAGDLDKRVTQTMAMISARSLYIGVVNTQGIEVCDKGTFFTAFISIKAKSGDEETSGGDFLSSRTFNKDLRDISISAAERALECFGRKALREKYVGPVIFENMSWSELFSTIFTYGISALNVQENRSVYKDKIGEQVAEDYITVIDDGTLENGFGTSAVDDEGCPRQKTPIIERGVLRNYLYDNYSAKREGKESTGNASRQRLFGTPSYANQPSIKPSNLLIMPGKGNLNELIGEIKEGILVKGSLIGALHSNVLTGDFSVTSNNTFKIENGEVSYPLKPCTVAGNLYEALNSVLALGNDLRSFGNIICPSIIVKRIVVST